MMQSIVAAGNSVPVEQDRIRLHVVFNNLPYQAGLQTGWGFACLIDGLDKVVLFDTGGNGDILLSNMQRLGLDVDAVEAVVLSHIHGDHTGGLDTFLACNPDVTVYMPESFPAAFQREVMHLGAAIETLSAPRQLLDRVYSTGEMNHGIKEQALILDTPRGLVVIMGCAHPNVADMAEQAPAYLGKKIYLVTGGFHLDGRSDAEIRAIIKRLKALGVSNVAPSHCTGNHAIGLFRDAWKDDFIEGGLGAVIQVPR
ncbi:MAG: MBL fold metallo-hydrolase [Gammaproteobacteria bacterium]|jgi:7,8-dihydropterin-6-yl-methyl-4-(beta-D-ribofuranosyl)aminobenzene 5'-phosphate synthase